MRDALDAAGIPLAAFEARGMRFMDGGEDVRAFCRACVDGRVMLGGVRAASPFGRPSVAQQPLLWHIVRLSEQLFVRFLGEVYEDDLPR